LTRHPALLVASQVVIKGGSLVDKDNEDATLAQRRKMNRRVWALTKKLDKLVQRCGGEILARDLPVKREFVLTVRLSDTQRWLYNEVIASLEKAAAATVAARDSATSPPPPGLPPQASQGGGGGGAGGGRGGGGRGGGGTRGGFKDGKNLFELEANLRRVYNHPGIMVLKQRRERRLHGVTADAANGEFDSDDAPIEEDSVRPDDSTRQDSMRVDEPMPPPAAAAMAAAAKPGDGGVSFPGGDGGGGFSFPAMAAAKADAAAVAARANAAPQTTVEMAARAAAIAGTAPPGLPPNHPPPASTSAAAASQSMPSPFPQPAPSPVLRPPLLDATVELHGLISRPELNGRRGVATAFADGRYQVRIAPPSSTVLDTGEMVAVKPTNCRMVTAPPQPPQPPQPPTVAPSELPADSAAADSSAARPAGSDAASAINLDDDDAMDVDGAAAAPSGNAAPKAEAMAAPKVEPTAAAAHGIPANGVPATSPTTAGVTAAAAMAALGEPMAAATDAGLAAAAAAAAAHSPPPDGTRTADGGIWLNGVLLPPLPGLAPAVQQLVPPPGAAGGGGGGGGGGGAAAAAAAEKRDCSQQVMAAWRREWRRTGGADGGGNGGGGGGAANGGAAESLEQGFDRAGLAVELSGKVVLALQLLREAVRSDEKVLLFSQSLETLDVLEHVLTTHAPSPRRQDDPPHHHHTAGGGGAGGGRGGASATQQQQQICWQSGLDYLRLDGSTASEERERMVATFNDPSYKVRLFIMSTRAGGLGLNLAAASRVIVFDANWNPSHDLQAVYRAYRYGQTRPVFIYRLISEGIEQRLYRQQVVKLQLSGRVLDEQSLESAFTKDELKGFWRPIEDVDADADAAGAAAGLGAGAAGAAAAAAAAPPDVATLERTCGAASWLPRLVGGAGGGWVRHVEDHQLRLEDTEEMMDLLEQENAANDLNRDANHLSREEARCGACDRAAAEVPWRTLNFACAHCKANTLLPPAPPLVRRVDQPCRLEFVIHGENQTDMGTIVSTCVGRPDMSAVAKLTQLKSAFDQGLLTQAEYDAKRAEVSVGAGGYHLQWRELEPGAKGNALGPEEGWQDGAKLVGPGKTVGKRKLNPPSRCQVRVRARLQGCTCGEGDDGFVACAEAGTCLWTPWSNPSTPATPIAAQPA